MADYWSNSHDLFTYEQLGRLCNLIQEKEIDVPYLSWLCDLYPLVPQFLKYALLAILQMLSGHCDSGQLKNRVKSMLMSYPLSPEKLDIGAQEEDIELSKRYINFVKTMSMSRSLLGRLSQHRIHQQLHRQPVGNSIIIPEKLMSGEAAFLNVSKSTSYKPIIFDCTSLEEKEVDDRVCMKLESGIKSEIMEAFDGEDLHETVKEIFFYWLAAHHMNETVSPIWLEYLYSQYSETAQPFKTYALMTTECTGMDIDPMAKLKLPPERIKDYFNQPSAVVVQKDDLLVLLDEFLSLVAT